MVTSQPSPKYELPYIDTPSFPDRVVSHYLLDSSSIRSEFSGAYSIPEEGAFVEDYGLLDDDSSLSREEGQTGEDPESDAASLQPVSLKRAPSSKSNKDPDLVKFPPLCIVFFLLTCQGHLVWAR
jgi:hypothetical protein